MTRNVAVFAIAALLEIAGCFAFWAWLRRGVTPFVLVLGVTQIVAWGAIFYPPVLTVPLIAAERGWSMTFAMGGFSLALLTAGIVSPRVGLLIDRLTEKDTVSIVTYAGTTGVALTPTRGTEKATIRAAVNQLRAGGSTNGEGGLRAAYDMARRSFIIGRHEQVEAM